MSIDLSTGFDARPVCISVAGSECGLDSSGWANLALKVYIAFRIPGTYCQLGVSLIPTLSLSRFDLTAAEKTQGANISPWLRD